MATVCCASKLCDKVLQERDILKNIPYKLQNTQSDS